MALPATMFWKGDLCFSSWQKHICQVLPSIPVDYRVNLHAPALSTSPKIHRPLPPLLTISNEMPQALWSPGPHSTAHYPLPHYCHGLYPRPSSGSGGTEYTSHNYWQIYKTHYPYSREWYRNCTGLGKKGCQSSAWSWLGHSSSYNLWPKRQVHVWVLKNYLSIAWCLDAYIYSILLSNR